MGYEQCLGEYPKQAKNPSCATLEKQYHDIRTIPCIVLDTIQTLESQNTRRESLVSSAQAAPTFSSHMSFHTICWLIAA